ncbi:GAF domain-containing protein [Actinopolymorpha singaporensis]|uniref:GAF domain-containing protein n=1 Tax=Actinopolymorpha singaporensis TaxID=117157 RepID=UPI000B828907|nr:GAF domain-containing protein [Actinopolymorpha singaporensis]
MADVELELRRELEELLRSACRIAGAGHAALALAESDWNVAEFLTCDHDVPCGPDVAWPSVKECLDLTPKSQQVVRIPARGDALTERPPNPQIASLLAVPVRLLAESYGWLCLLNKAGDADFTDQDEELAAEFATSAARAVEISRLRRQQRRRERWLKGASELTTMLLGEVDLFEAMGLVTRRVREISGAEFSSVVLCTPEDCSEFAYNAVDGLGLEGSAVRIHRPGIAASVIESGRPVVTNDVTQDKRYNPPVEWQERLGVLGLAMFMPLTASEQVLGTLVVGWRKGSPEESMAAREAQNVQIFADQAALALQQVRVQHERTRHELWVEATSRLASLLLREVDRDEAMRLVVSQLRGISGADFGGILLVDPSDTDSVHTVVFEGVGIPGVPSDLNIPRQGLVASVIESGRRVVSADYARLEGHLPPSEWQAALSVVGLGMLIPLIADGQMLGVLFAAWRRGSPHENIAAGEVEQVQTFADLASLALQRVRTQNDHEELLLLQDRQRISRDLHDHVLQHMFGISLRLKSALDLQADLEARQRVGEAIEDLDETSRQVRAVVFGPSHDDVG